MTLLCTRALKAMGHEVLTSVTGEDALKTMNAQHVDLLVSDILLPEMDGIELLREMKAKYPHVRVICMSGGGVHTTGAFLTDLAKRLGAFDVLVKPFTMDALKRSVSRALDVQTPVEGNPG